MDGDHAEAAQQAVPPPPSLVKRRHFEPLDYIDGSIGERETSVRPARARVCLWPLDEPNFFASGGNIWGSVTSTQNI